MPTAKVTLFTLALELLEKVGEGGAEIQMLNDAGVELVGFANNDRDTPNRCDFRYVAVWKMLSLEHVEMLEHSVEQAGWHEYFKQVNARDELIPPPAALEAMVKLD